MTARIGRCCPILSYNSREYDELMGDLATLLWLVYAVGVVWGLIATDARPASRVGLALVWPIGPLAFVVTVVSLLAISPVALIGRR